MTNHDAIRLVRDLRGTPLTVLMMMMVHGCPTGRNELAVLTTYSERTVQKALSQLELLGLAQNHGRYNGWVLAAHAYQGFLAADPGSADQTLAAVPRQSAELPSNPCGIAEAQILPLGDARPATAPAIEVQSLHLDTSEGGEVQKLNLDQPTPITPDVPAQPERPTNAARGVREVHNLHLPDTTDAPAPDLEVQILHLEAPNSTGEVQNVHLPSSSSCCSSDQDTKTKPKPEKPQLHAPSTSLPPRSSPEAPPAAVPPSWSAVGSSPELPSNAKQRPRCRVAAVLDDDAQAAVALLTATGCPIRTPKGKGALDAVEAALAGGWSADQVYAHVRDWLDYGNRQNSIVYPGLFTIARIRACQPAPEPPPKSADQIARDHIAAAYDRIVRH